MKRTKRIDLNAMRKGLRVQPTVLAVSIALVLAGCDSPPETAHIYQTVDECVDFNPSQAEACDKAYKDAMAEAEKSGPKYKTVEDCAVDFKMNQCVQTGNGIFVPMMAGFMIGRLLDNNRGFMSSPVYTSYSSSSPLYGSWHGADGSRYGSSHNRLVSVDKSAFKSKAATTSTLSRGGFGSVAKVKASWSSASSSRSSWGGWGG